MRTAFDVVLMDIRMPDMDGITALKEIRKYNPAVPVVLMTAYSAVESAVEAMKSGAVDYLIKPLDFDQLKSTLFKTLEHSEAVRSGERFPVPVEGIVGNSPAVRRMLEMIHTVAPSEATVLINGKSGTGKELVARAIHNQSQRKDGPWVAVNCAALTESLLESELFGHEKGAFTGADKRRDGRFLQADGGTLFLDEIGELPIHLQVKLLRAIENKMYTPVGSNTPKVSSFRLVAATNQDLSKMVLEKKDALGFLLPRTCAFHHIAAPARAARGHPAACRGLHGAQRHQLRPAAPSAFGDGTLRLARQRARAAQFSRPLHGFGDVPVESLGDAGKTELLFPALHHEGLTLETATLQLEERLIRQALERCRWRRGDAAEALGLNLRTSAQDETAWHGEIGE